MTRLHLAVVVLLCCASSWAQQVPCSPLTLPTIGSDQNMFSTEMESVLGDVVYEQISEEFKILDDPALTAHAQRIADAVAQHLPLGGTRPRVALMDLPEVNAYSLPGGRLLLSRKLIALTRTEDELASVIAHELGHSATREAAVDWTRRFRKLLGVQSVSSADEVYQRYHEVMENANRNRKVFRESRKEEDASQETADRIGMEALVRAGYDANAYVEIFDRTAQLKGQTGSWWSNLWGSTPPDARRLKEAQRTLASITPGCIEQKRTAAGADFAVWKKRVIEYSGSGHVASLRALVDQRKLEPALMPDLSRFRFSRDGKYVLAQDETGVAVFTREPFKAKFRIDAPDADAAQFTPDMKAVVLHYGESYTSPRVERWSLADGTREDVNDVHVSGGCRQSELAPDGKLLLCVKDGQTGESLRFLAVAISFDLQVLDVESGETIFEKKNFGRIDVSYLGLILFGARSEAVNAAFSPDSRYMLVSSGSDVICLDLQSRTLVQLPGNFKSAVRGHFTFVDNERVLGRPDGSYKYSIVKFPSGEKLVQELEFGVGRPTHATSGEYVFVRPVKDYAVGVYDLKQKKIVRAYRSAAIDIYDGYYVRQREDADVEVRDLEKDMVWDKASLPPGKLRRLRAVSTSPDLNILAASLNSRGAVWDLLKSKRLAYVRGFEGAYIPDGSSFYAQFPKRGDSPEAIAAFDLRNNNVLGQRTIDEKTSATQYSQYVLVRQRKDEKDYKKGYKLEIRDLKSDSSLWTLPDIDINTFEFSFLNFRLKRPYWVDDTNGTFALWASGKTEESKKLLALDPDALRKYQAMRDKQSALYISIYDLKAGTRLASFLLDTGKNSYSVEQATMVGDRIVLTDNQGRILLLDRDGQQRGRIFGRSAIGSAAAGKLCVHHSQGRMEIYDLSSLKKLDELVFPENVTISRVSGDGKKMLVVTADQTVYTLDLTKVGAS